MYKSKYKTDLLLLFVFLILVLTSCTAQKTIKSSYLKDYPLNLKSIISNNAKVPSFSSDFTISINNTSFDGKIVFDKEKDYLTFRLNDVLTDDIVLDVEVLSQHVFAKIYKDGILDRKISRAKEDINLKDYFEGINISFNRLLKFLTMQVEILDDAKDIVEQDRADLDKVFYKLSKEDGYIKQLIALDRSSKRLKELIYYRNGKREYFVKYKKYIKHEKFVYPVKVSFYHVARELDILIYFSNTVFPKKANANNDKTKA